MFYSDSDDACGENSDAVFRKSWRGPRARVETRYNARMASQPCVQRSITNKRAGKKNTGNNPTEVSRHNHSKQDRTWVKVQPVLKDYFKVTANNLKVYRWSTPSEVLRCNLNSQTPSRSCTKWQYWSTSEDSAGVPMTTAPCMARHVSTCFSVNLSCRDRSESGGESSCDRTRWLLVKDYGHVLSHESCRSQWVSTPQKEEMRQPCDMLL